MHHRPHTYRWELRVRRHEVCHPSPVPLGFHIEGRLRFCQSFHPLHFHHRRDPRSSPLRSLGSWNLGERPAPIRFLVDWDRRRREKIYSDAARLFFILLLAIPIRIRQCGKHRRCHTRIVYHVQCSSDFLCPTREPILRTKPFGASLVP